MTNIESLQQQILDASNMRHATKVFDDSKVIAEAQFTTILEAARLSPSSFGFEPYQLLVVQSPQKRELFRDFTWGANGAFNDTSGQLGTASHFVIFLAHTQVNMQHNSDYLQTFLKDVKQLPDDVIAFFNQAYQKFQEHDFKVTTDRQITDWCGKQAYIALANMMTTAALMGIDSCPIEGFEQDKTIAVLEEHFAIDPALYKPAVMAAFGYRVQDPPRGKTRRTMAQLVSWY